MCLLLELKRTARSTGGLCAHYCTIHKEPFLCHCISQTATIYTDAGNDTNHKTELQK